MSSLEKPNVILIIADTLRRDHIGAFGAVDIHTPNLNRFAEEAVVFDNYRIGSFPTMPARADLLTGRFSFASLGWEALPTHLATLPGILSDSGYMTMAVVDTPFYVRNGFGYDRGFKDF